MKYVNCHRSDKLGENLVLDVENVDHKNHPFQVFQVLHLYEKCLNVPDIWCFTNYKIHIQPQTVIYESGDKRQIVKTAMSGTMQTKQLYIVIYLDNYSWPSEITFLGHLQSYLRTSKII